MFALLLLALAWFLLGGRDSSDGPTAHRRPDADVDRAELERAEQDVREAPDEDSVRDWGPGASPPPVG